MTSFDSLRHSELVRGERYSEFRAVGAEARVATLLIHSFPGNPEMSTGRYLICNFDCRSR